MCEKIVDTIEVRDNKELGEFVDKLSAYGGLSLFNNCEGIRFHIVCRVLSDGGIVHDIDVEIIE